MPGAVARYLSGEDVRALSVMRNVHRAVVERPADDGRGAIARYLRIGEGAAPRPAPVKKRTPAKEATGSRKPQPATETAPKRRPPRPVRAERRDVRVRVATTVCPGCDNEIAADTDQCPYCALFLPRAA